MKTDWKAGDTCWIYGHGHKSKGTILEVLDLSRHGYSILEYLIEIQTSIDPVLEVRNAFTMAESEEGEIGLFSNLKPTRPEQFDEDDLG